MHFQLSCLKMMLLKCCTQYTSKFGKLSSGHRARKGQFSFHRESKPHITPGPKETLLVKPSEGRPISRPRLFTHVRILNSPPFELLTLFLSVCKPCLFQTQKTDRCSVWHGNWLHGNKCSFFSDPFFFSWWGWILPDTHGSC